MTLLHACPDDSSLEMFDLSSKINFFSKFYILFVFYFQTLTSDMVLNRPSDPLEYMIEEIEKIQEQDRHRKGVFLKVNKQNGATKKVDGKLQMDSVSESETFR